MDDGQFAMANGLGTSGWEWVRITRYGLTAGKHTLTIAYRENGAKLDKICISKRYGFVRSRSSECGGSPLPDSGRNRIVIS